MFCKFSILSCSEKGEGISRVCVSCLGHEPFPRPVCPRGCSLPLGHTASVSVYQGEKAESVGGRGAVHGFSILCPKATTGAVGVCVVANILCGLVNSFIGFFIRL